MMRNLHPSKNIYFFLIVLFTLLFGVAKVNAGNYFSVANGNWNTPGTWAISDQGTPLTTGFPLAGDAVTLTRGITVTIGANAACATINPSTSGAGGISTLLFGGAYTLTVSGNVAIGGSGNIARDNTITFASGSTLEVIGSLTLGGTGGTPAQGIITMTAGGTLKVGSLIVGAGGGTWNPGTGTVQMTATNTLPATIFTSFYNLQINSGTTTLGVALNSIAAGSLSVKAGATLAFGTISFGATTAPPTVNLECGASGSSISGTGAGVLHLGGPINITKITGNGIGATISCPVALDGARTFTVNNEGTTVKDLTLSGIISTANNLIKAGPGTMELSGLNTYSGTTTVSEGILRATTNNVTASANGPFGKNASGLNLGGGTIQSNVGTFSRPITVTVTNSGLDAYGSSRTISSTISLSTAGTFNLNIGGTTAASAEGQDLTLSGIISNSSGTLGLTKIGTSNVTLSGANTYTGTTTVTSGELRLNPAANTTPATQFVLNGGILSTTGITTSRTITSSSTLKLDNTSTITLGANAHTLTFAASNAVSWSAGTLTITGWTGAYNGTSGTAGKIFVGSNASGLTSGQLGQIQFFNGSVYSPAMILSTGEVVPSCLPPSIIGSSGSRCGPGTVSLGATASAGTINWYADSSGGSSLGTGTSFTTPSLSFTTNYYVDATDGGCTSTPRTAVQAVIISPASISVGGAGTYCNGSTISLTSSGANLTNQYWTGPNGYYSTDQNPVISGATAVNAGTYIVTGSALSGINLVANSDFELGNIGFVSSYTYVAPIAAALQPEGVYTIVANSASVHSDFSSCTNHTPSGTLMMVVNGAAASLNIWTQTVNVVPNTAYQFTYWVQSVHPTSPSQSQLYVNGAPQALPYFADATTCTWKQFVYNWTSGSGITTAILELRNQNLDATGNDFALDDIVFQQACEATASGIVTVNAVVTAGAIGNPQTICSGYTPAVISSTTVGSGTGTISYEWQTNASGPYVTIPGATTATYTPPALAATTSYQRRTVAVSGGATCYSAAYTTPVTITVNGPTVNAGGPDAVCHSASPVAFPLTGASFGGGATTAVWSVISGGGTLSSLAQTATPATVTYTPANNFTGTVTLQLKTNNIGAPSNCDAIAVRTITVNSTTTIISQSTGAQTQCIGGTFTPITVTVAGASLSYQWYSNTSASTSGGTPLGAGNGAQTNSYTPQTNTAGILYYYCIVSGTCGTATSAVSGAFLVDPVSVGGSVTGGTTICSGSTSGVLTLAGQTGTITRWESSVSPFTTWTPIVNTIATYTSGALTQTTQFRAVVTSGVCSPANSNVVTVTVNNCNKLLNVKVYLEGPYAGAGAMYTTLRTNSLIPLSQPYNVAPWSYAGLESVSAPIPAGVVDWVLVEVRQAADPASATSSTIIAKRAAFLKSDGIIVDLDGTSKLDIGLLTITNNLYVVIRHRNHLAIMSNNAVAQDIDGIYNYNYSVIGSVFGLSSGYKVIGGVVVMVSGDSKNDGGVSILDYNRWALNYGKTANYYDSDLNFDGNVSILDYNKWALSYGSSNDAKLKSATILPVYFSNVPE